MCKETDALASTFDIKDEVGVDISISRFSFACCIPFDAACPHSLSKQSLLLMMVLQCITQLVMRGFAESWLKSLHCENHDPFESVMEC